MNTAFASFSCRGARKSNQDRVLPPLAAGAGRTLTAIADGVGGGPGGDVAAETALAALRASAASAASPAALVEAAADALAAAAGARPELGGMATTLSLALIEPGTLAIAHVGDSRIHLIRGGAISLLTEDQTLAAELARLGLLDEAEAERDPRRNMLTSALTPGGGHAVQTARTDCAPGDRILLTTDGLHMTIGRARMAALSAASPRIGDFVAALRLMAEMAGPDDNYSAVAVELL